MVARQIAPEDTRVSLTAPAATSGRGGGGVQAGRGAAPAEPRTTNYEYVKDWNWAGGGGRGAASPVESIDVTGNLVFAGNGYFINKGNIDPYQGIDVKGKIVVVAGVPPEMAAQAGGRGGRGGAGGGQTPGAQAGAPAEGAAQPAATGRGAAAPNPLGTACTDYLTPEQYAAKNGALAVVSVQTFQQLTAGGRGGAAPSPNGPAYVVNKFGSTAACPSAPSISAGPEMTSALFQGERSGGSQVFYAAGSNAKLDSFELSARKTLNIKVRVRSTPGHAENVIGMLEGSDPALKNEYVIFSAHLDHLGLAANPLADGHTVYNGADDDGSGTCGLLSVAHAYAEGAAKGMRPKRTMIFLWVGGEEKGLWGSQYFNQFPPIDLSKVVADLNMDMVGRAKTPNYVNPNPQYVLVDPGEVLLVGPNISSTDLEKSIETVNEGFTKMKLNHFYDVTAPDATHDNLGPQPNGQRIFYRSDHYNFAKNGIPIAFFTTGLHADYHQLTDTPDKIDYAEMQQILKLMAASGWALGNQEGRPKLNATLPDQLVKDMKTAKDQSWGQQTPVLPPLAGEPF